MASSSGQFLWQPFYPSTHRLSRKKIPCRSVAATMLHVAAMFDSEWKMVRFDDLKSQNHQNPERRSFWIEAFHSDLRSPILQVFVAANSNAVLRLVHVDLLDSESHIARPIKTHQDGFSDGFSDWFSDWFSWVEVANGTVLQKLKAIV